MRVPTLAASHKGVSPVIGTILMVAITVVLAAVLYVSISSLIQPPERQTLHLILAGSPATTNSTNASFNDTFFTISAKTGPSEIFWNSTIVEVFVYSPSGILLTGHNVSFDDLNPDGKASVGDKIHLRGMTAAYHAGTVKFLVDGKVVAEATLP